VLSLLWHWEPCSDKGKLQDNREYCDAAGNFKPTRMLLQHQEGNFAVSRLINVFCFQDDVSRASAAPYAWAARVQFGAGSFRFKMLASDFMRVSIAWRGYVLLQQWLRNARQPLRAPIWPKAVLQRSVEKWTSKPRLG
jgi:hypothetical protein